MRRAHHASFWFAWLPALAITCAGACDSRRGAACHSGGWEGQCNLRVVTKVRTIERFPRSFVVLEGLYEPASGSGPGAPSEIRKEFTAQALQENDLRAYLEQHPSVSCSVRFPQGAACEQVVADVALEPFQGTTASAAESGPRGCALIERGGLAPNAANGQEGLADFPFPANTSTPSSDAFAVADSLSERMKSDARIQCVALSGQVAADEEFPLADQRARAVRKLLTDRGVEPERLTVFSPTVPTYAGTSAQERQVLEKDRNVRATVVIYAKSE